MIIDEREKQIRKNLQIIETARPPHLSPLRAQTLRICDFELSPKDFKICVVYIDFPGVYILLYAFLWSHAGFMWILLTSPNAISWCTDFSGPKNKHITQGPNVSATPIGQMGLKTGWFPLGNGVCLIIKKAPSWQSQLAAQKERVVTTIIFSDHKTY